VVLILVIHAYSATHGPVIMAHDPMVVLLTRD